MTVRLTGRDTQSWAGFYGIKFAQTRLRLVMRSDPSAGNEESETIIEPKADEEPLPEGADTPIPDTAITPDEEEYHCYQHSEDGEGCEVDDDDYRSEAD